MDTPSEILSPIPPAIWEAYGEFIKSVGYTQRYGRDRVIEGVMQQFFDQESTGPKIPVRQTARSQQRQSIWANHQRHCQRFLDVLTAHYPQGMPQNHQDQLTYPEGLSKHLQEQPEKLIGMRYNPNSEARPLDFFVRCATLPQLKALLKLGAKPVFSSAFGTTPLGSCALRADWRRARVLLQNGADVHIVTRPEHTTDPNAVGSTMLYRMLFLWQREKEEELPPWGDRKAMLEVMLEFGADIHMLRQDGRGPMDAAGEEERHFLSYYLAQKDMKALDKAVPSKPRNRKGRL